MSIHFGGEATSTFNLKQPTPIALGLIPTLPAEE
jgi:hypothetical protein